MQLLTPLGWILVFSSGLACGAAPPTHSASAVALRASYDFECPESSVRAILVMRSTYEVVGCDKRALYVCNDAGCQRDTDILPVEGEQETESDLPPAGSRERAVYYAIAEQAGDAVRQCLSSPGVVVVRVDLGGAVTGMEVEPPAEPTTRLCVANALAEVRAGEGMAATVRYRVGAR